MSGRSCRYCTKANGSACGHTIVTDSPRIPFHCTRDPGHKGDHVLCDGRHALARWPKQEPGGRVIARVAGFLRTAVVEGEA